MKSQLLLWSALILITGARQPAYCDLTIELRDAIRYDSTDNPALPPGGESFTVDLRTDPGYPLVSSSIAQTVDGEFCGGVENLAKLTLTPDANTFTLALNNFGPLFAYWIVLEQRRDAEWSVILDGAGVGPVGCDAFDWYGGPRFFEIGTVTENITAFGSRFDVEIEIGDEPTAFAQPPRDLRIAPDFDADGNRDTADVFGAVRAYLTDARIEQRHLFAFLERWFA